MIIGLSLIFGIAAIFLLMGKGSFLIAGYNTASKSEKERYDEKKLCRVMGTGLMLIALGILSLALNKDIGMIMMMASLIIGIMIIMIGSHFCYKDEAKNEMKTNKKVWYKNTTIWSTIVILVILIGVSISMFVGSIGLTYHERYFTLSASLTKSTDVYYLDIQDMEYVENFETGTRIWGLGNFVIGAGTFKNDQFGSYTLYSYNHCHDYIVLKTELGTVVVNGKNSQETKKIYQEIQTQRKSMKSN